MMKKDYMHLIKKELKNILIFSILFLLSMGISYGVYVYNLRSEVIFLIYVVAVVICVIETKSIYYALLLSIIFVLSFNFFFTEPFFTLKVDDPSYLISFIIFVIVSSIVGTLVSKLQRQIKHALDNESKIKSLYDLSNFLYSEKRLDKVFPYVCDYLKGLLTKDITIVDINYNVYGKIVDTNKYLNELEYCFNIEDNFIKENKIVKNDVILVPIFSKTNHYGVLFCSSNGDEITRDEIDFLYSYLGHLLITLDKEYISEKEEEIKQQVETERFRTSLLRSLSHDLKTPLTSIQSGSSYILENNLSRDDEKVIIKGIYDESCDLQSFVENLLLMTKASQPRMLQKKSELVLDVVAIVNNKFKNQQYNSRKLHFKENSDMIFVYCDVQLLIQVLVNIIDNAFKYTKENSIINVSYQKEKNSVRFIIEDNGGGIDLKYKEHIFEDYFSLSDKGDMKKSSGLGLGICRSVVEAHGGTIDCFNNNQGGATFTFTIPDKE